MTRNLKISDISNCERDPVNQVAKYHRLAIRGHRQTAEGA